MIYFFIISVTLNIFSLSKLYIDGSVKNKLKTISNDYNHLLKAYKQLQADHKQVTKHLEASQKSNYKDMMKIYLDLKKQNFNDNYIYNYICNK